jgi:hypothetical protein
MKIEIQKEINSAKLFDELLTAGLVQPTQIDGTSPMQGNTLYLPDGTDTTAIQVVIDGHDPTPSPEPLSETEQRIEDLELAMASILGGA